MSETREIPGHIRRTFIELKGNQSYRNALEWMRNEWIMPEGPLTEESGYLKGIKDCLDLQAGMLGLEFTSSLTEPKTTNENDDDESDGT